MSWLYENEVPEDPKADYYEKWLEDIDNIVTLLGEDVACQLLWDAFCGEDIRGEVNKRIEQAFEDHLEALEEYNVP